MGLVIFVCKQPVDIIDQCTNNNFFLQIQASDFSQYCHRNINYIVFGPQIRYPKQKRFVDGVFNNNTKILILWIAKISLFFSKDFISTERKRQE
jgi:hypothetical protein